MTSPTPTPGPVFDDSTDREVPVMASLDATSVELEQVTKKFGDVMAVNSVDLAVEPGELLVLLGPSGCGKSTVLRLVAGLEEPTEGVVRIGDRVMNEVDPSDRDVAMVFQSYALYPHMSVRKNIEFPLKARHVDEKTRQRLVADVARSLQLETMLDRRPAQLSGGQRQRVALGRAIVRRPHVFLMDEPLSNLDAQLRLEMRAELVELHARLGITLLYVTHDQTEAMTMGHRIAVMSGGVLQQIDTPGRVHDLPANAFVAGFIGFPPMNIIPARLQEQAGVMSALVRGGSFVLPMSLAAAARRLGLVEILLGARPDALLISPSGTVDAKVSLVESFGREHHGALRLPGGQLVAVRLEENDTARYRTGDEVRIAAVGDLHLFEPLKGQRVDA